MHGVTIQIFLEDGTTEGCREAYFTGSYPARVMAFSRSQFGNDKKLGEQLQHIGIYMLLSDIDDGKKQKNYIGQSVNLAERLRNHDLDRTKDFWGQTLAIIGNDHFNSAHAEYLEGKLVTLAKQANRADAQNGTIPIGGKLSKPEQAFADNFLDQIEILLSVLGFDFTKPIAVPISPTVDLTHFPQYQMTYKDNITAYAVEKSPDSFIVLKGSFARSESTPSLAGSSASRVRQKLREDGQLVEADSGRLSFVKDVTFTSRSIAASVVGGTPLNGHIYWKLK